MPLMFQEKKISMHQYLLSNNESFGTFLDEQDDQTILQMGLKYISWEGKFLTLVNMAERMAPVMFEKFLDFNIVYYLLSDYELSLEVARFLYDLDKKLFTDLYFECVDVNEIRSDLIGTSKKERQNIIAEILKWNFDDISRMDLISVN
jgi:hypothetical protein